MTKVFRFLCLTVVLFGVGLLLGCEQGPKTEVQVEKMAALKPNLPSVPTLPPAPHPTQYSDQSYSVYGLRRQIRNTIGSEVSVTGFIAKVYQPPPCPEGQTRCPVASAPHMWLADSPDEPDKAKTLLVAGYAENQGQIDEAVEMAFKGQEPELPPESTGLLPIPVDFFKGAKIRVKGRFAYISSVGFQSSEGVLEYNGHTVLEAAAEAPPPLPQKTVAAQ